MKKLKWVTRGIGLAVGLGLGLFIQWDMRVNGHLSWRSAAVSSITAVVVLFCLLVYQKWFEKIDAKFKKEFPFYMLTAVSYASEKKGRPYSLHGSDKPTHNELFAGLYNEQTKLVERGRELAGKIRSAVPGQDVSALERVDPIFTKFMQECMTYKISHLNAAPAFVDQYIEYAKSLSKSGSVPDELAKELADWTVDLSLWSMTTKRLTWFLRPNRQDK